MAAVYGGHYPYFERKNLLRRVPIDPKYAVPQVASFSCVTMFREPIERVESCYYFRFLNRGLAKNFKCMNNATVSSLESLLRTGVDGFGDGCLDEPFRIFSGVGDNAELEAANDVTSPEFCIAMRYSMLALSGCSLMVLGEPTSYAQAASAFPQVGSAFLSMPHANVGKSLKCELDELHVQLLEQLTAGETVLYNAVQRRIAALETLRVSESL